MADSWLKPMEVKMRMVIRLSPEVRMTVFIFVGFGFSRTWRTRFPSCDHLAMERAWDGVRWEWETEPRSSSA